MASRSAAVANPRSRPTKATGHVGELRLGHPAVLIAGATCSLVVLGLVMILSASSVTSFANYGSSFLFFKRQLLWTILGMVSCGLFCRIDYRKLRNAGYFLCPITILLLIAVLVPGLGVVANGSARWLALGPVSFQPSELAKLAIILLAADVFARKRERMLDSFSHTMLPVVPALLITLALVILQPDLGTTVLLGTIGMGMLFVAGAPFRQLTPVVLAGAAGTAFAALSADYRRARVLAFMDPWADPLRTGYHTIQSLIAMGSGGWFGVGLGASRQKWMYIPNAHTDFIFAILGEEMGLLGTGVVLGIFCFIAYLGIRTAMRAPDRFGMLIASGITIWISAQALVNMGAVTASLPITGVPLPLVSFGGSSLLVMLSAMGILTNVALQGERKVARRRARAGGSTRKGRSGR